MDYDRLEKKVIKWAKNKGIMEKGTPLAQMDKTLEEVFELNQAITMQSAGVEKYLNSKGVMVETEDEIIDGLGDVLVTLIIQSEMQEYDLLQCLFTAYSVIKGRTGKMEKGTFVKDN